MTTQVPLVLPGLAGASFEQLEGSLLSDSLRDYIPEAWEQSLPTTRFVHNWHHDAIADHLQAVSLGHIRYLLISVAPRHTKSWITSVFWPTWHWTRWPATQWVFASYTKEFAVRDAIYSRTLMDTLWYQGRWGCSCETRPHKEHCKAFKWRSDQNVKESYENDRGGRRLTAGVEAGTTGQGGDILVFDDALDIKKADSEAARRAANKYIDQVWLGRMNDPGASKAVGIAQRTHQDDPTGHLLAESSLPWFHLKIPTEWKPKVQLDMGAIMREVSPIGWEDPRKEEGDLLWPARFTPEIIEHTKVTLGSYSYSAQHGQEPSPLEGGILKRQDWRFWFPAGLDPDVKAFLLQPIRSKEGITYPPAVELPHFMTPDHGGTDEILLSLDASFKDVAGQIRKGKKPDPISLGAWGRHGPDCFLLDCVNDHADIEATIAHLKDFIEAWPAAVRKLVEDKANGPAILAIMRRRVGGMTPVTPTAGKVSRVMTAGGTEKDTDARAMSMAALLEAHNVFLPHPAIAPWIWGYIEEHANFPNGTHDDNVDMTSQALMALQPGKWREQDKAHGEVVEERGLPAITDTREILRRRVYAASGLKDARERERLNGRNGHTNGNGHNGDGPVRPIPGRVPRVPFVDPYRRGRR